MNNRIRIMAALADAKRKQQQEVIEREEEKLDNTKTTEGDTQSPPPTSLPVVNPDVARRARILALLVAMSAARRQQEANLRDQQQQQQQQGEEGNNSEDQSVSQAEVSTYGLSIETTTPEQDSANELPQQTSEPEEVGSEPKETPSLVVEESEVPEDLNPVFEEYHVEFQPRVKGICLRYYLMHTRQAEAVFGSIFHWTGTHLYLPAKLPRMVTRFEANHLLPDTPVQITLSYVCARPESDLFPFYNSFMRRLMHKISPVFVNQEPPSPTETNQDIPAEQVCESSWPSSSSQIASWS